MGRTPFTTPCVNGPEGIWPCRPEKPDSVFEEIFDGVDAGDTELGGIPGEPCIERGAVIGLRYFFNEPPEYDD